MKKALLIGINYNNTQYQLKGCINDINNMSKFLQNSRKYSNIVMLSDETFNKPTKNNILSNLENLIKNSKKNDELFFHYSGHGTLLKDRNKEEESGMDSCICPLDFETSGLILDDDLRKIFDKLPLGVRLYIVLDCCHSGTGCDLRFKYEDTSFYIKGTKLPQKYDPAEWTLRQTVKILKNYNKTNANIFLISGCKDNQTSADGYEENESAGALTYCLLKTLKNNFGNCKWKNLLKDTKCLLQVKKYTQIPVLTSGNSINMEESVFLDI